MVGAPSVIIHEVNIGYVALDETKSYSPIRADGDGPFSLSLTLESV